MAIAEERTRVAQNNRNKRRRDPPNQTIINCDLYINLESSSNSTVTATLIAICNIVSLLVVYAFRLMDGLVTFIIDVSMFISKY